MQKIQQHPTDSFDTIESALDELSIGNMIVVVDSEHRENEGDFVMAAEFARPEDINFMAMHGRGIICAPLTKERAEELGLDYMVRATGNNSAFGTPFTVSVDLARDTSTGISCSDRSKTFRALASSHFQARDFVRPGHVFPLIAREGGVLEREGHTEAAVDLLKMANLTPTAVICEIMNSDGCMARTHDLIAVAKRFNLKIITISQIMERLRSELRYQCVTTSKLPTSFGTFKLRMYEYKNNPNDYHIALVSDNLDFEGICGKSPLIRIHSECFSGDIFSSLRCDCGEQLSASMQMIAKSPSGGVLIYLRQEGRGIGAVNKIRAYNLQDEGLDTVSANHQLGFPSDLRNYKAAADILNDLKITRLRLITNNPHKLSELTDAGFMIEERTPIEITPNEYNEHYLLTKRDKMGHFILKNLHPFN
ncbi:MAG: 3,4-dihydroxy-2-butanone-4-phosphate synthase [Oligoflexia bacterium]|nr:3,4-dihydroxy-2-butanone-4-phosphate synthase [Oligoflexia bacterium]MBF0367300.1 3,4-dihydroxy-2-butanone-4-phosphate synthase [Oligoflexia bacterium]